jgi:hypothetical protein
MAGWSCSPKRFSSLISHTGIGPALTGKGGSMHEMAIVQYRSGFGSRARYLDALRGAPGVFTLQGVPPQLGNRPDSRLGERPSH